MKLSISLPDSVTKELEIRSSGNISGTIAQQIERYTMSLFQARLGLREKLSEPEMGLILDTLNGTMFIDTFSPAFIAQEIADAVRYDRSDEKWECDGEALIAKMAKFSYAENLAIVDAAERFWLEVKAGKTPPHQAMLR